MAVSRLSVWSLILGLVGPTQACSFTRVARTPMAQEAFARQGPAKARGAIVLLPGFGDSPETFAAQGFVAQLERHAPGYDLFAADAHFGYYRRRNLLERLEQDVIGPLRAQGYRELWLAGASMGGHGAVAYARTHPEGITGVMLFAPYMGPRDVIDEVKRAGGLCRYQEPAFAESAEGFARANFGWLKRAACDGAGVSIWLAVGDADRLLPAGQLLGQALDPSHVLVLPGGHGWKVWTPAVAELAVRAFGSDAKALEAAPLGAKAAPADTAATEPSPAGSTPAAESPAGAPVSAPSVL